MLSALALGLGSLPRTHVVSSQPLITLVPGHLAHCVASFLPCSKQDLPNLPPPLVAFVVLSFGTNLVSFIGSQSNDTSIKSDFTWHCPQETYRVNECGRSMNSYHPSLLSPYHLLLPPKRPSFLCGVGMGESMCVRPKDMSVSLRVYENM